MKGNGILENLTYGTIDFSDHFSYLILTSEDWVKYIFSFISEEQMTNINFLCGKSMNGQRSNSQADTSEI